MIDDHTRWNETLQGSRERPGMYGIHSNFIYSMLYSPVEIISGFPIFMNTESALLDVSHKRYLWTITSGPLKSEVASLTDWESEILLLSIEDVDMSMLHSKTDNFFSYRRKRSLSFLGVFAPPALISRNCIVALRHPKGLFVQIYSYGQPVSRLKVLQNNSSKYGMVLYVDLQNTLIPITIPSAGEVQQYLSSNGYDNLIKVKQHTHYP